MNLLMRVAFSQNDCPRAQEARRLLKTHLAAAPSLIRRVAASEGDRTRAGAALALLADQAMLVFARHTGARVSGC